MAKFTMPDAETLKKMADGFLAVVPHVKMLGLKYEGVGKDWAELRLPYAPHLVAYPETGVIASGAIFSLMDTASGMAVLVKLGEFAAHATLDLRCDYLRPATPGKDVVGHAECYKITKRMAFVRGIAHDGDPEHPIAHVAGTFMFTSNS